MSDIIHLSGEGYEKLAASSEKTLLIDFYADWCGPCRMLSPIIEEVAAENNDVIFCKVNTDDEPDLTRSFGLDSIPALLFIKNGEVAAKSVGLISKDELTRLIEANK